MGAEIQRPFFTEQFVKVAYLEYGAYIIFLSIKSKVESRKQKHRAVRRPSPDSLLISMPCQVFSEAET